jgi:hypothetical protein
MRQEAVSQAQSERAAGEFLNNHESARRKAILGWALLIVGIVGTALTASLVKRRIIAIAPAAVALFGLGMGVRFRRQMNTLESQRIHQVQTTEGGYSQVKI